MDSYPPLYLAG